MKKLLTFFLAMIASVAMMAQVTTSSISGKIVDENGPLPGATVIATHIPSGSSYFTISNSEGRYTMQGMRVGGPYTIEVRYVGYATSKSENVTLKLGETYRADFTLDSKANELGEIVVSGEAEKPVYNSTSTTVNSEEIAVLPTITRSIVDVVKVSPYANNMSFAGSDGRSTNFTVDGANFNNNFGLSSNLPGGGTPISVDAIEEVQVVVAPFDVRQSNFVGGGINAITKSGTNQFHGSAYTYYTNQTFRGNRLLGENLGVRPEESTWTYGATVGGPIVKDKLFFFLNAERTEEPSEVIKYRPDAASASVLDEIYDKLKNDYGYDAGSYTNYPGGNNNLKLLARIDWNINDNNKLMFRFNKTGNTQWNAPNGNSCDDNFRNRAFNRSGENAFPFSNNMYSMRNDVMSFATELNSRFSTQVSNQFIFTYTDKRKYVGQFKNGLMDGFGTYTWSDGSVYEGYWSEDHQQGRGKYTNKEGDLYDGNWQAGEMHGEGVLRMKDGYKFKGIFSNGKKNGKCVEEDKDGTRFEGSYVDDVRDGAFVEKDRNGTVIRKGYYKKGVIEVTNNN